MSIVAEKVLFIPTGTYEAQYYRPFESNLTSDSLEHLKRRTRDGQNLEANALAGAASGFLAPTAQAQGDVSIANGWGEKRYRFIIELNVDQFGLKLKQILTGYTDHLGTGTMTATGYVVDPNMALYINNVMTLRETVQYTNRGQMSTWSVLDNSQLVREANNMQQMQGQFGMVPCTNTLLRPYDVFCRLSSFALEENESAAVIDYRTGVTNGLEKSQRRNGGSATYLSRVLKSHQGALRDMSLTGNPMNVADAAADTVSEGDVYDDPALHILTARSDLLSTGAVSYGQMCQIIGNFDNSAAFLSQRDVVTTPGMSQHTAGSKEHWGGCNRETLAATILNNSVSNIMADTLLTQAWFHAHNQTPTGEIVVSFNPEAPYKTFSTALNPAEHAEVFRFRLAHEVLMEISHRNQIPFMVDMRVDLLGETHVTISLDGYPPVEYAVPSFCDALSAPIVASNQNTLNTLATDIETLSSHLNHQIVSAM